MKELLHLVAQKVARTRYDPHYEEKTQQQGNGYEIIVFEPVGHRVAGNARGLRKGFAEVHAEVLCGLFGRSDF